MSAITFSPSGPATVGPNLFSAAKKALTSVKNTVGRASDAEGGSKIMEVAKATFDELAGDGASAVTMTAIEDKAGSFGNTMKKLKEKRKRSPEDMEELKAATLMQEILLSLSKSSLSFVLDVDGTAASAGSWKVWTGFQLRCLESSERSCKTLRASNMDHKTS